MSDAGSSGSRSGQGGAGRRRTRRTQVTAQIDESRGVFMISVAAELADMHPQTLRMYEARGLISPQRSPRNTRLYSHADVERLRRIQQMTAGQGLNLAGVETVLELEDQLNRARAELARMRRRADEVEQRMLEEVERVRRSLRAEIVPYGKYEAAGLGPEGGDQSVTIPVRRADEDGTEDGAS